jgi:toluene monooxygenase electron transfer component
VTQGAAPEGGARWRIQVEGGTGFDVSRDEDTLLRGALRAGCGWAYECSVGGCGSCRFDLLEGDAQELWPGAPGLSPRDRQRGKRLACQTQVRGDLRVRVRLGAAPINTPTPRRFEARLAQVRTLTADMAEFTFAAAGPADFLPGQYALAYLPGVAGARAYSMSNLPNDRGCWQIIVKRMPGGQGSSALFERVGLQQPITLDGPYGHAHLDTASPRDIACIGGGSGLGPMLSIVRGALAGRDARRVHLFIGLRSQADLGALQALDGLVPHPHLQVSTALSAAQTDPPWSGATGFVHEVVERTLSAPLVEHDFYFAGPPPMVEAVQSMLVQRHQVHPQQLRFDRFV